ncbi:hypothetical protein ACFWC9_40905 [Streptomyces goshikiensis]|uniref:hypothetical protein n=1 Tax=Streptomyces goshikiensis TaxID=1942 RepID=UPI00368976BE
MTYSIVWPGANGYFEMMLTVSSASGSYAYRGMMSLRLNQSVGNMQLRIPQWHQQGSVDYVDVVVQDTQCETGLLGASPPVVTSMTFTLPGGPNVIMVKTI